MEDGLQHEDKCRVWDDSEFCDCGSREIDKLEKENAALVDLIQHIWVHAGYANNGYMQMTTEQKQLFDRVKRKL